MTTFKTGMLVMPKTPYDKALVECYITDLKWPAEVTFVEIDNDIGENFLRINNCWRYFSSTRFLPCLTLENKSLEDYL